MLVKCTQAAKSLPIFLKQPVAAGEISDSVVAVVCSQAAAIVLSCFL